MESRILQGTTPTLVSYPRVRPGSPLLLLGVPSSASAKLTTPAESDDDFVSATVDAVSTTVTKAAKRQEREVAVTAATLIAGRRYLLDDGTGDVLDVECRRSGTSTTIASLSSTLARDVDVGATFKGFAVTRTLTADETADVGECSVLWQATVDGGVVQWPQLVRICARVPSALLTPEGLRRAHPIVDSLTGSKPADFNDVINAAWEHRVVPLLEARGLYDDEVIADEALVPLHAFACLLHLVEFDPRQQRDYVDGLKSAWGECVSTTFARKALASQDQSEALAPRVPGVAAIATGRLSMRR